MKNLLRPLLLAAAFLALPAAATVCPTNACVVTLTTSSCPNDPGQVGWQGLYVNVTVNVPGPLAVYSTGSCGCFYGPGMVSYGGSSLDCNSGWAGTTVTYSITNCAATAQGSCRVARLNFSCCNGIAMSPPDPGVEIPQGQTSVTVRFIPDCSGPLGSRCRVKVCYLSNSTTCGQ